MSFDLNIAVANIKTDPVFTELIGQTQEQFEQVAAEFKSTDSFIIKSTKYSIESQLFLILFWIKYRIRPADVANLANVHVSTFYRMRRSLVPRLSDMSVVDDGIPQRKYESLNDVAGTCREVRILLQYFGRNPLGCWNTQANRVLTTGAMS